MTAVEVLSMTQPPNALTQAPLRSLALGDSRGRRAAQASLRSGRSLSRAAVGFHKAVVLPVVPE